MLYKVGDRVIIRQDLNILDNYDGYYIFPPMKEYCGRTATIAEVNQFAKAYRIRGCKWRWTDSMILGLEDECLRTDIEVGDYL